MPFTDGLTEVDNFDGWTDGTELGNNPGGTSWSASDVYGGFNTMGYWSDGTQANGSGDCASQVWDDGNILTDSAIALEYRDGIGNSNDIQMALWLRIANVGFGTTGYRFSWYINALGTDSYKIERADGIFADSDLTLLTSDESGGTWSMSPGDVILFQIVDDVLTAYVNDFSNVLLTFTDSVYTSGLTGIGNQNFEVFLDDCYLGAASAPPTGAAISGSMHGTGSMSGTVRVSDHLSGTMAGLGAMSGTVSRPGQLTGTMAGTGATTGSVKVVAILSGTSAGTSTLTGAINFVPALVGTMAGVSSLTGAAHAPPLLSGSADGSGTLTGGPDFPAEPPVNVVAPTLHGDYVRDLTAGVYLPADNSEVTITVDPGAWSGSPTPTFEYEFFSIGGHTFQARSSDDSLVLTKSADISFHDVNCRVYATNDSGEASATLATGAYVFRVPEPSHVGPAFPLNKTTVDVGVTVTVSNPDDGNWFGMPPLTFTYQWVRVDPDTFDQTNISGATSASYTAVFADVGFQLACDVTAHTDQGQTGDELSHTTGIVSLLRGTAAGSGAMSGVPHAPAALIGTAAGHGSATGGLRALGRPPLTMPVNVILDATPLDKLVLSAEPTNTELFGSTKAVVLDENTVNAVFAANSVNVQLDDSTSTIDVLLDENSENAVLDSNTVNNVLSDRFP